MAIFYSGDGKLEAIMNSWDRVLTGMEEEPPESTLRSLFHRQIKNSHAINFDLDIYDRCIAGNYSYTYDFLRKAVTRHLTAVREESNRKQTRQALITHGKGSATPATPKGPKNTDGSQVAAPAQADPKGKAKGKGKGDQPCFREMG